MNGRKLVDAEQTRTGVIIVGVGKIARDQHVPTIRASDRFDLASVVSGSMPELGVPVYTQLDDALRNSPDAGVVVLCTPPSVRIPLARAALAGGCALMIEKPPATTVAEALTILQLGKDAGRPVFASWHSRFAPMIETAAEWIRDRSIVQVNVLWRESVHKWHPGQRWLWEEGGFGVFDPGINAFSILTKIFPGEYQVRRACYDIPENAQNPIAVELDVVAGQAEISVSLDFLHESDERWEIECRTSNGETLRLSEGGAALQLNGGPVQFREGSEYKGMYARLGQLIDRDTCDFDLSPLEIIESANAVAVRRSVAPIFN